MNESTPLFRVGIISASVRTGRKSHHVALYFESFLKKEFQIEPKMIDLATYNFPVFNERLKNIKDPLPSAIEFSESVKNCDGLVIVTPEYNGGIPASLKNAIDLIYDELHRKPVAICTVSSGAFGGSQVLVSLQFTLWKMRTWTVPAMFPVANVEKSFNENGSPTDEEDTSKRAKKFIEELIWCMEAGKKMR